jgi:hypothetical protein
VGISGQQGIRLAQNYWHGVAVRSQNVKIHLDGQ